ncbi:TetR/AcrR family transcriptional regulator [Nocardia sp. NPDC051570]|uniref:TetR/AcrR family transcriptional regulator n=1 Tax=Nocardia sp. NPDC051570 TaxID=3364324 RepID=UPI0037ACB744
MESDQVDGGRVYGGRSTEQRRAQRREQLVRAALEIWGAGGWAAVTIRGVCARANLIDRYFYENFVDKDAILAAAWDHMMGVLLQDLAGALSDTEAVPRHQIRAVISMIVRNVQTDPVKARVAFGSVAGNDTLEQRRRDSIHTLAALIASYGHFAVTAPVAESELQMTALVAIGGCFELLDTWLAGSLPVEAEQIIDFCTTMAISVLDRWETTVNT